LIAFMRPTKSTSLYIQMAGRGCRLADNKENCLCLDFADVVATHGPIDRVRVKEVSEGKGGDAPTKTCEVCETICHASVRECPDCGFKFPEPKTKLNEVASILPIMSTEPPPPPEWVNVTGVSYRRHEKQGKTPSLCVSYRCGLSFHREWICVEHTGFARSKAVQWWAKRDTSGGVPDTVDDALAWSSDLAQPSRIQVRQNGKFTEVVSYDFTPVEPEEPEPREYDRYAELEGLEF
jgi:DNA repair protein RadD